MANRPGPGAAAQLGKKEVDEMVGMAQQEMEYRVELFNKLTQSCFDKCIEKNEVTKNLLSLHCVMPIMHPASNMVTAIVGQLLSSNRPPV